MQPDAPTPTDPLLGNSISGLLDCALGTTVLSPSQKSWVPPSPEELAKLLPQYEIDRLIGRGGMGAVYHGAQPKLKREVAIKLLPAEYSTDSEFIARFEREAQVMAQLHHPNIVTIYDFGQTSDGCLFFVMEFINGANLHDVIHGAGLNPAQALELTVQICEALQYAHSKNVIHRDIKPANILVAKDGQAKVADFGFARPFMHEHSSTMSVIAGTLNFMAPEQMTGKADQRADIYALGATLYEMLTGTHPGGMCEPPSVRSKQTVDVRLDEVVAKAMRYEPERRYQHVSEMQSDVDHIRTSKAGAPVTRKPRKPMRTADIIVWTVVLVLLGGLGFVGYQLFGSRKPVEHVESAMTGVDGVVRRVAKADGVSLAMLPSAYRAKPTLDNAYLDLVGMDKLAAEMLRKRQDALGTINHLTNFKQTPVREGTPEYVECMAASKQIEQCDAISDLCNTERPKLVQAIRTLGGDPAQAEAHCASNTGYKP